MMKGFDMLEVKQCDGLSLFVESDCEFIRFLSFFKKKLIEWQCYSLVARSTLSDLYGWHFIEALSIVTLVRDNLDLDIVDFGAGGGVIGIVLAKYCLIDIKLVERSENKRFFLEKVMKYNLVFPYLDSYEKSLVIIRGVSSILVSLNLLYPVGKIIFFKSSKFDFEIVEALRFYDFCYNFYSRQGVAKGVILILYSIVRK